MTILGSEDPDDPFFGHIKNKRIRRLQREYLKHVEDSDGFDVLDFTPPGMGLSNMIVRIDFKNDMKEYGRAIKCTDFAIDLYNRSKKPKSELERLEIEKVNATSSVFPSYFITFRARDNVSKQTDTYETKVCYRIPDNFFEMRLFRKKGTKKGMLFRAHFDDKEDYDRIEKCTHFAISKENDERQAKGMSQLKLERIVKASFRETTCWRTYYITLEAKDTDSDDIDLYITKMYIAYSDAEVLHMMLFRPKGGKKGIIHISCIVYSRIFFSLVFGCEMMFSRLSMPSRNNNYYCHPLCCNTYGQKMLDVYI